MSLVSCESCGRHVRGLESECPFCRTTRTRSVLALIAVSSAFAMACATKYGAPPPSSAPEPPPQDPAAGEPATTPEDVAPEPPPEPSARLSGRY